MGYGAAALDEEDVSHNSLTTSEGCFLVNFRIWRDTKFTCISFK